MTLQAIVESPEKIPETLRDYYREVDGRFVLDVDGMKTQEDFDRYAEAIKKRYADNAADLARKQGAAISRDEIMGLIEDGMKKFAPAVTAGKSEAGATDPNLAAQIHDLERNLASVTKALEEAKRERDQAVGTSRETTIRNSLTQAASAAGVRPEGVSNLVNLVAHNFEIAQDGSVVTKLEADQNVSPNQKPSDFFQALGRQAEFRMFWPASKGAGADAGEGSGGSGDLGSGNPWTKAGWNVTAQGKLFTQNKDEALRLMKAAGFKPGMTKPAK